MNEPHLPAFAARITSIAHRARRRRARISVVELDGELDAATCDACYRRCTAAGPHVVVELGGLRFMDASGFRALDRARAELERRGGSLVWCGASGEPARFLRILEEGGLPVAS